MSASRNAPIKRVVQPLDAEVPSMPYAGCVLYLPFAEAQNLVNYSQDFNHASPIWEGYCGNKTNIVYNTLDLPAPDGTFTASKFTVPATVPCDGTTGCWGLLQYISPILTDETYTASIWLRGAVGGENVYLGLNDLSQTAFVLTPDWVRYTHTGSGASAGSRGLQFRCPVPNTVYYAWGAQLEKKNAVHPYALTLATPNPGGTTAVDLSGLRHDASLLGATPPAWASGPMQGSLLFDATNWILAPNIPQNNKMSWSFWYINNALGNMQSLITNLRYGLSGSFWILREASDTMIFEWFDGAAQQALRINNVFTPSNSGWANYVVTADYTIPIMRVSVNGVFFAQATPTGATAPSGVADWRVGTSDGVNYPITGGRVSELRAFNRILTADEIWEEYYRASRGSY